MKRNFVFLICIIPFSILLTSCGIQTQGNVSNPQSSNTAHSSLSTTSLTASETTKRNLFSDIHDYSIEDPKSFTSDDAHFTVSYPGAWPIEIEPYQAATSKNEASLMWGLRLLVAGNKNEFISVFKYQSQAKNLLSGEPQVFVTNDMTRGKLSYELKNGEYDIVLTFDAHIDHGVIIRISEGALARYKSQILGILKSIQITE